MFVNGFCIRKTFWTWVFLILAINNLKVITLLDLCFYHCYSSLTEPNWNVSSNRNSIIQEYTLFLGFCIRKMFRTWVFLILKIKSLKVISFLNLCFLLAPIINHGYSAAINRDGSNNMFQIIHQHIGSLYYTSRGAYPLVPPFSSLPKLIKYFKFWIFCKCIEVMILNVSSFEYFVNVHTS